ncbi:MAG: hypothetical protein ACOH2T_27975 [Pseudomonas sp.]
MTTEAHTETSKLRALTDDDIGLLLAGHCAPQVADIIDRCAVQTSAGHHFTASAAAQIADLVFDIAGPLMTEIVALGTGTTAEIAAQLPTGDRLIATLQIVELTLADTTVEQLGQRVFAKLLAKAAPTSALATGSVRH